MIQKFLFGFFDKISTKSQNSFENSLDNFLRF